MGRYKNHVCKLTKSLYGLGQALRQWFQTFSAVLSGHGFHKCEADHFLFTKGIRDSLVVLLVYVDDITLAGPNTTLLQQTQQLLEKHFKLKVLGKLQYFLGLEIATSPKGIHLCQHKYVVQLLQETSFLAAKPLSYPMDPNLHLNDFDGTPLEDPSQYRRLIGRLMYLTISKPDISFTVNKLSQYMTHSRSPHLTAIHHLLQYIKSTPGKGILFPAASSLNLSA